MKAIDAHDLIPTCGCGDPGGVYRITHWTLAMFAYKQGFRGDYDDSPEHQFKVEVLGMDSPFEPLFWAFLSSLDRADLIEHGSTVRQSWLTPLGERLLAFLDHFGEAIYDSDFEWSDGVGNDDPPPEPTDKTLH